MSNVIYLSPAKKNAIITLAVQRGTTKIVGIAIGGEGDKRHLSLIEAKEALEQLKEAIGAWEGVEHKEVQEEEIVVPDHIPTKHHKIYREWVKGGGNKGLWVKHSIFGVLPDIYFARNPVFNENRTYAFTREELTNDLH